MQPFVALDFETANGKRASACSIGLAKFNSEGHLVDSFHSLIQPHVEHRFFHPANTWIHGIRQADVEDAPEWNDLIGQVESFVEDLPLISHNFGFDGSVLNQITDLYCLEPLNNSRYCTMRLARRIYPELPSASLATVFEYLFPDANFNHHHAEADAIAAGQIFSQMQQLASLDELSALLGPARKPRSSNAPPSNNALNVSQLVEHYG
ncbi:exonuclease domain-containing protein, partial [Corynebacterium alimapuense]